MTTQHTPNEPEATAFVTHDGSQWVLEDGGGKVLATAIHLEDLPVHSASPQSTADHAAQIGC